MSDPEYLYLSWADYHILTQKLAAAILHHSEPYDEIVAIARGGLTLGHLLSDLLRLPVSTFAIQSYTDIQKSGEIHITQTLRKPINGKRVLLVDDVADSGKTFKRALSYLRRFKPAEITTVAMFHKPLSKIRPDYFAQQTDKWILFPYEPTEMITFLIRRFVKDGLTKKQIQDRLLSIGFREGQIAFVRHHHEKNIGV